MNKFLIIDVEAAWDEHLHEAYRVVEPGLQHHRLASKRIFAASAFSASLADSGAVEIGGLTSWLEQDYGDDAAIAAALFDHIRFHPDHQLVSWAGLAADVPILSLTAMQAGLALPEQLRAEQRFVRGTRRPHLDLALAMKGQGRDWSHMSEVLIRLGVPPTLIAGKARVDFPRSADEWEDVRAHVELDTVLTAIALFSWLSIQGAPGIQMEATMAHLASWFLRNRSPSAQQQLGLEALYAEMAARIAYQAPKAA